MLQEVIVNLQQETKITICICDHQARDLLACVDIAMILSNCKAAKDSAANLIHRPKLAYNTRKPCHLAYIISLSHLTLIVS